MESYLATIMGWAPNFAPRGWAFCLGQTLSIAQNQALFSLLGTIYGGNGTTTFMLPNMAGRMPIGVGTSAGLGTYVLGQVGGTPSATLTTNNMPAHVHDGSPLAALQKVATTSGNTVQTVATDTSILGAPNFTDPGTGGPVDVNTFANNTANPSVNIKLAVSGTTGPTGGTQPFSIMPPYLAVNWIIAMEGIYPPRD